MADRGWVSDDHGQSSAERGRGASGDAYRRAGAGDRGIRNLGRNAAGGGIAFNVGDNSVVIGSGGLGVYGEDYSIDPNGGIQYRGNDFSLNLPPSQPYGGYSNRSYGYSDQSTTYGQQASGYSRRTVEPKFDHETGELETVSFNIDDELSRRGGRNGRDVNIELADFTNVNERRVAASIDDLRPSSQAQQAILLTLEAQSRSGNSGLGEATSVPGVNYSGYGEALGFKATRKQERAASRGDTEDTLEEDTREFLAEQLRTLGRRDVIQLPNNGGEIDLIHEMRAQFGDSFTRDVMGRAGYPSQDIDSRVTGNRPQISQFAALQGQGEGQQNAPQIDQAAVGRVQAATSALSQVDGQDAAQRAAMLQGLFPNLTAPQINMLNDIQALQAQALQANGQLLGTEQELATALGVEITDIQTALQAQAAQQQQLVVDLTRVDTATKEAFFDALRADDEGLAATLEAQVNQYQQTSQSQGQSRETEMLSTEQLRTITFADEATRRQYAAAVDSYAQIAAMPMIGPILNMFMESFGMGPHSIIRENAADITEIGQEALESITRSNPDLAGEIPQAVREAAMAAEVEADEVDEPEQDVEADTVAPLEVRTDAAIAEVGDVSIAEDLNALEEEQEAALATALGLEGKNERELTEAATLVASSIDGMSASDIADGISGDELAKIQQVMGSDLGQAIQAALSGDGVTFDGVAETAEMQTVGEQARAAAAGRGQ